ncbi:RDD family protein [Psychroflexus sp. YR1-1]|uniref:RDD family protein n=1 Tax=Psychroflexus aurantiacus TaxID=2709310 RepID=A0A6B3R3Q8_9FLAO|nr:RDD family protein [Psychroflexus aurantiacus]NEV95052.1 RDD family protein [Psychroflexus aurantiacus]
MEIKITDRLINYIVDVFIITVSSLLTAVILKFVFDILLMDIMVWLQLIFFFVYYMVLEYKRGQTIGKMVTKTKVEYPDKTNKLNLCFVRTISRLIPLEPFSVLSPNVKMWHDKLSNTNLVKV